MICNHKRAARIHLIFASTNVPAFANPILTDSTEVSFSPASSLPLMQTETELPASQTIQSHQDSEVFSRICR